MAMILLEHNEQSQTSIQTILKHVNYPEQIHCQGETFLELILQFDLEDSCYPPETDIKAHHVNGKKIPRLFCDVLEALIQEQNAPEAVSEEHVLAKLKLQDWSC
jgi:hypothetical protein